MGFKDLLKVWDVISSFGDNLKLNKINYMFGIFKKKTEIEKLEIKYKTSSCLPGLILNSAITRFL